MEYKQNIIDLVGEENLKRNFKDGLMVTPIRKTVDTNAILKTYANENYIIKYISNVDNQNITSEERQTISNMMPYLREFYSLLISSPRKYYDSELTKEDNMKGLCPPDLKDEIVKKFQEYNLKEISTKAIEGNATSTEKSMLMEFFCRNIKTEETSLQNAQSKYVEKMLRDNKKTSEYQRSELKFLAKYINNWMANGLTDADVYIGECKGTQNGYYTNNLMYINKISENLEDLPSFIQFVCHLTEHNIQDYYATNNKDNSLALSWIVNKLFEKYESTEKYICKKINYRILEIETDAEEKGYEFAERFYDEYSLQIKFKSILERRENASRKITNCYDFRVDKDKRKYSREDFIYLKLKEVIQNNPEEISKNLLLLHIFNRNGEMKGFLDLLSKDTKNIETCRSEIIDDILISQIAHGYLENLTIDALEEESKAFVYNRIIHIMNKVYKEIQDMNGLGLDYDKVKENGYTNNNGTIGYNDMYQICKKYLTVYNYAIIYLLENIENLRDVDVAIPDYNYTDFLNSIKQSEPSMVDNLPLEEKEKNYYKVLINTYKEELKSWRKKEAKA